MKTETSKQTVYFSHITADHWTAKNNLQKAAHKIAVEMDRRIVLDDEVALFKADFKTKIDALNIEFKRCKPQVLSIGADYMKRGDISFSIDGVFQMSLFKAKQ